MNKRNLIALALTSAMSFGVNADLIGATGGVDFWYADAKINDVSANDAKSQQSVHLAFEHFIPLIPNAKVRYTGVESAKFDTDFEQYDLIAYYEILDSDLLSLDIGLNLQHFKGTILNRGFEEWQPSLYANGAIGIPGLPFSIFASFSAGDFDGTKTADAQAGVAFSLVDFLPLSIDVKAGYRIIDHDFGYFSAPTRIINDGFFLGLEIDI